MIIVTVQVKLNAKLEKVHISKENYLMVSIRARPIDGEAKERLRLILAEWFQVPNSLVILKKGLKGKTKIYHILK